ncbi:MAG TPA: hypothetical protein VN231_02490 [Allosphingosinicella sp.]|nr:hypothetical protein [Allosphingosinicella sp.]
MIPDDPAPLPLAEAEAAADAAAVRRRWITLAEILGVIAVLISALTLWNNYQQRAGEEAAKEAERREASAAAQALLLRATPDREGGLLALAPADPAQTIQSQTIAFPSALGAPPVETVIEPRIEARWFERALLRARTANGAPGESRGDERLPVAIATTFYSGGEAHRDTALYDIGYRVTGGGLLGDRDIRLRGLSRLEGVAEARLGARLDSIWRSRHPGRPAERSD